MYLAKRILAFLLCLVMLLSIFGCTPKEPSTNVGTDTTQTGSTTDLETGTGTGTGTGIGSESQTTPSTFPSTTVTETITETVTETFTETFTETVTTPIATETITSSSVPETIPSTVATETVPAPNYTEIIQTETITESELYTYITDSIYTDDITISTQTTWFPSTIVTDTIVTDTDDLFIPTETVTDSTPIATETELVIDTVQPTESETEIITETTIPTLNVIETTPVTDTTIVTDTTVVTETTPVTESATQTETATETVTETVTDPITETATETMTEAPTESETGNAGSIETTAPTETAPAETTDPNRPTQPSKIPEGYVQIAEYGYAYYRVVYEDGLPSIVRNKITKALSNIESQIGVSFEMISDAKLPAPSGGIPEILIGDTNRAESHTFSTLLRTGEYKVSYSKETKNILVAGGGFSALGTAIDNFFADSTDKLNRYSAIPENYKFEKLFDFPIQSVTINGVALQEYVIVYSSTADILTEYAALNLSDYIENNMGVKLKTVTDKTAEQKYEILIGKTKRSESNISTTIGTGKYILMQSGDKIVMQGNGIYVGAAVGAFVSKLPATGNKKAITINDLPTTPKAQTFKFSTVHKNAIILIGDGMGFNHIEMAKNGGMKEFYAEQFPNKGEAVTRSLSVIEGKEGYTDSAAAATALATGYKTYNGRVGVGANKETLKNIRELAYEKGAKTAVVTTDVIGGATPGGFLAHNAQRKINNVTNPDIINQIEKLITEKKVDYTMGRESDSADAQNPDILKGTREALAAIASGGDQFFLMVEAAYIDKDSHNNRYDKCVAAVKQYNEVIAYLTTFVFCHPTTSLVVTADHETGSLTPDSSYKYGYKYTSGDSSYRQHTNKNVPVYAIGPKTEYFKGYAVENVCIPHFSAQAFGTTTFGDPNYYNKKTALK